ncbi:MAG TPA: tRNA (adenosine(37)-N6)-threonylcarbamoyltransferase complex dimerization subunit type 1 TsaB [Bacteroidia bacterium]|nr:tRNA (adenosine(37)-N6)-threonylcarbamoyltransferase complex dimerization subunit type 1 TsaB [Bacteroidia bacterium]
MSLILNLETSTKMCSVALASEGRILGIKEQGGDYNHAENLTLFIEEVFHQASLPISRLDAIAVSKGPGSYTGLRIGVSVAKGLCYSLGKPLLAIDTLEALRQGCIAVYPQPVSMCPMLDARRMEVYCALYNKQGKQIQAANALIVDEQAFHTELEQEEIVFFGDGAPKCRSVIKHAHAVFLDELEPSARFMISLSEEALTAARFEDVAYFVPAYLKDFQAGKKTGT